MTKIAALLEPIKNSIIKALLAPDEHNRTFEMKLLDDLIEFSGGPELVCANQRDGKAGAVLPCMRTVDPKWGGPLTKMQWVKMCPACRCYFHLSTARNDFIEHNRTK